MPRLRRATSSCAREASVLKLRSSGCENTACSAEVSDGVKLVNGLSVVVCWLVNDASYEPPPHFSVCASPASPDQKSVWMPDSPENRLTGGVAALLRRSDDDTVGRNAASAAAARASVAAGS